MGESVLLAFGILEGRGRSRFAGHGVFVLVKKFKNILFQFARLYVLLYERTYCCQLVITTAVAYRELQLFHVSYVQCVVFTGEYLAKLPVIIPVHATRMVEHCYGYSVSRIFKTAALLHELQRIVVVDKTCGVAFNHKGLYNLVVEADIAYLFGQH